jgi:hypothetical protein
MLHRITKHKRVPRCSAQTQLGVGDDATGDAQRHIAGLMHSITKCLQPAENINNQSKE